MNIPNIKHISRRVKERAKHHVKKVSQVIYEEGDPDFVDERKTAESTKEEKSFVLDEKGNSSFDDEREEPNLEKEEKSFFESLFNFEKK